MSGYDGQHGCFRDWQGRQQSAVSGAEALRSGVTGWSGRRKSANDVSGHDGSMAALTFGDIIPDQSADVEPKSGAEGG